MYTATAGYAGPDSLTYTVADDQGYVSAPATVTVNVAAPPPAPKSGGGGSTSTELVMLLTFAALARVLLGARGCEQNPRKSPVSEGTQFL